MDVCARAGVRVMEALMRLNASSTCALRRARASECFGHCVHFGESPGLAFCASWVKLGLI